MRKFFGRWVVCWIAAGLLTWLFYYKSDWEDIAASALIGALFLALGSKTFHHFTHPYLLEWFEAGAAGAYVIVGVFPLFWSRSFLANIMPLGHAGDLISTGSILLINYAVGVEVTAGFILLLKEFFRPLEKSKPLREP